MEEEKDFVTEAETEEERERRLRRRKRIEQMQREKKKAQMRQRCVIPGAVIALVLLILCVGISVAKKTGKEEGSQEGSAGVSVASEVGSSGADVSIASEAGSPGADAPAASDTAAPEEDNVPASGGTEGDGEGDPSEEDAESTEPEVFGPFPQEKPKEPVFEAVSTDATAGFEAEIISEYGVLIEVDTGTILAEKGGFERINPASMTKILTVLTAADALGLTADNWETMEVLDDTFTITIEITDYAYVHDCSIVGFDVGEEVTVRDLFYGTILPSGGDAALGLACYVAGSQEAFVELMNQKLEELGLSDSSHFTNCVGLYDSEHYTTPYDMAVMLKTAADSTFCRQVLSAHTYTTSETEQHPEGILVSNWFLRRIEDRDTHGEVLCGKTGYVVQSGNCAASLAADGEGREYLCVTAGSSSSWRCIYDHVALYQKYLRE